MYKHNEFQLWEHLMSIANIGADPEGGISRFAWTKEYKQACLSLISLAKKYNIDTRLDTVGNLYFHMDGKNKNLPKILIGSHLDTVPHGGCFDGIAGVMAGLEALIFCKEKNIIPEQGIDVIAFVNEEGTQFLGGTFGSRAVCGNLEADYVDSCKDYYTGQTMRDAMVEFGMGLDPDNLAGSIIVSSDYLCFIELHIEQGRYLLDHDLPVAIVTDIAGIQQMYAKIHGESCHAGGMAMASRHDTLMAAASIASRIEEYALKSGGKDTRATVGYIKSMPGIHNVVPGETEIPIDFREDNDEIWTQFYEGIIHFFNEECNKRGLSYEIIKTLELKPAHCNKTLVHLMEDCADDLGIKYTKMVSYPCHDAVNMERIMPIGMIFLRSLNGGVSHCPQELTSAEDFTDGANILLNLVLKNINDEGLE